ncbi:GNAT family N-acetyltransferase [Sulfitobacter sp. HNIBRBA2951]|uniref:GNAT family N-acetyltransferase n=1 Tax=Sulfitobacter aquimarinus TaxID=3158557 RepID=UPI0032DEDCAB
MSSIQIKPFTPADRDWIVGVHIETYQKGEGFDDSFGVLVAEIVDDFIATHDPSDAQGWIAWAGDTRVGSIFCVRLGPQTAQLRLFQVLPQVRGTGLGRKLLETCTQFARDTGYRHMKLWTHKSHTAACALYARNGWRILEETQVVHYGQSLTEQVMGLPLDAD